MTVIDSGPITCQVKDTVEPFRLVTLAKDGVSLAGATDNVLGAVFYKGSKDNTTEGGPDHVAVAVSGVVRLEAENVSGVEVGDLVEVAADGKVKKHASGTIVGVTYGKVGDKFLKVVLSTPAYHNG